MKMMRVLIVLLLFCQTMMYGQTNNGIRELLQLAEKGNAEAQTNLGRCYAGGLGVPQDYVEAVKWWRKAAEQGDAKAQNYLGRCYAMGNGVPQDYGEAVKWWCKVMEQGYEEVQNVLDLCRAEDNGVPLDDKETAKHVDGKGEKF